ncbi:hypothetical protein SCAR479_05568 [Seiridium cardinale]|uniref:Zn(2)-C6 fungal-type domain-containing protein n=1 Tax=Seiridium cardinale TaxID=138064 RepID=A0ABR2XVP8_9PEZI
MSSSTSDPSPADTNHGSSASSISPLVTTTTTQPQAKRTRVLLSCGACRASKLKCDRADPCSQCLKKGRPDACHYAPRPQKPEKPAKSMAARLRRLEGMVRGMLDEDGVPIVQPDAEEGPGEGGARSDVSAVAAQASTDAGGQVVRGNLGATSYVGGTHFAAILQDIDELKNYFEYPEEDEGDIAGDSYGMAGSPEFLLLSHNAPRSREELLSLLPEKSVIDRLMMRYFNSNSPSQHILHKPTFSKEYGKFWEDPSAVSLHWIAILFMVTSLGVFFSTFQAPHELENDSSMAGMDRFRVYRGAAGTALIWGKYSQPNQWTLQAMLLYVEADFLVARQSQMNCYLLSSVLIRLMLKMGLHRDPSKLPNLTPYDGEMRRRLWNLAIQIDLLVAFHLGLPAMIHGIESDTALPMNLIDTDFSQETTELPVARPASDYTSLSYPINKAALCRVFGLVARQAHSLKVPTYAEVMQLDGVLEKTYNDVPIFMKVTSMEKSITDPPMQVIQRYGLASLYQKSRCVLHRKYITDAVPKKEHEYSRKACLTAALELLEYQNTLYEACKPGGMLSPNGWFVSSLAVNDFLLADMVVALVIQSEHYSGIVDGSEWLVQGTPTPTKEELLTSLRRSMFIWQQMAMRIPDCAKASELVGTVTRKIETQMGMTPTTYPDSETSANVHDEPGLMTGLTIDEHAGGAPTAGLEIDDQMEENPPAFFRFPPPSNVHGTSVETNMPWMMAGPSDYDWGQFDAFTRGPTDQGFELPSQSLSGQPQGQSFQIQEPSWLDRNPLDDLDFVTRNVITGTTSFGGR